MTVVACGSHRNCIYRRPRLDPSLRSLISLPRTLQRRVVGVRFGLCTGVGFVSASERCWRSLFLWASPATPAQQSPQGNLLVNGDAEAGPGETDTVSANCPPSWSCFGGIPAGFPNVTAVRYGTFGVAGTDAGAAMGGGLNFFAGGPATELDGMSQVVGLSGIASEIDTGLVQVTVSGFLGGFGSEDDDAFLNAYPRDTNAVQLLPVEAPLVSRFDRNDQTALLARSATGALPPGTRSILVRVLFRRQAGTYLDGYADNLSLTLSGGPNPPPSSPGSGGGPGGGGAQVDKLPRKCRSREAAHRGSALNAR